MYPTIFIEHTYIVARKYHLVWKKFKFKSAEKSGQATPIEFLFGAVNASKRLRSIRLENFGTPIQVMFKHFICVLKVHQGTQVSIPIKFLTSTILPIVLLCGRTSKFTLISSNSNSLRWNRRQSFLF